MTADTAGTGVHTGVKGIHPPHPPPGRTETSVQSSDPPQRRYVGMRDGIRENGWGDTRGKGGVTGNNTGYGNPVKPK